MSVSPFWTVFLSVSSKTLVVSFSLKCLIKDVNPVLVQGTIRNIFFGGELDTLRASVSQGHPSLPGFFTHTGILIRQNKGVSISGILETFI